MFILTTEPFCTSTERFQECGVNALSFKEEIRDLPNYTPYTKLVSIEGKVSCYLHTANRKSIHVGTLMHCIVLSTKGFNADHVHCYGGDDNNT